MSRQIRHPLKEIRFTGGRFEQNKGWLDFDVLPELQTYKNILVETAKEQWKRNNPQNKYLPRNFVEGIHLGFREIREGSCAVPIERIMEIEDESLGIYVEDEFDEAARIIDATLIAVRDDVPFPEQLPARIIPMFKEWGKTLETGEGILLDGSNEGPRFDSTVRERLLNAQMVRYEDAVDLVGEVRAAVLKEQEGGTFIIQLENGESVPGTFTDEQEKRITKAFHNHDQVRLRIKGIGEFEPTGRLRRILKINHYEERSVGETPFDPDAPPIWEVIEEISKAIPEEVWGQVPSDLSVNLDHYLYGEKKEGKK